MRQYNLCFVVFSTNIYPFYKHASPIQPICYLFLCKFFFNYVAFVFYFFVFLSRVTLYIFICFRIWLKMLFQNVCCRK
jgi:hypothetical protein